MKGMCINWRVVAVLAAAGLVVTVALPGTGAVVFPVLLAAACPLSMLLMMRRGRVGGSCSTIDGRSPRAGETREERLAELESELAKLRAAQAEITSSPLDGGAGGGERRPGASTRRDVPGT
jgi:hypothetical protein